MSSSPATAAVASHPVTVGFAELLDVLGFADGDPVTVCHKQPGGPFLVTWTTAGGAPAVAGAQVGADVWFSVNGLARKDTGRGQVADVTRLAALHADLDVKAGGLASMEAAVAVVRDLSGLLGARPAALILSGHGAQPVWAVDPSDPAAHLTDEKRPAAVALLRRFGRLVAHVAEQHDGRVDAVFDLARVLRVPGTTNHKAIPVPARLAVCDGAPLTVAEVDERLTEYGAIERPGDREQLGAVVAPAAEWQWAKATHPAVQAAVTSWRQQTPDARHPWLLGCCTSLAFARRLGMVTEVDHAAAVATLQGRFLWLLARHGQTRTPSPGEVADCLAHGVNVAQRATEDTARQDWRFWIERAARALSSDILFTSRTGCKAQQAAPDPAGDFWTARPVLTHLRDFARSRRTCPWAVLGVTLARVVVATPARLVLPPMVGGEASLNLFAALVGPSGSGKGAAESAAADAVDVGPVAATGVGSGEGLAHLFMARVKGRLEQHTHAVLASVPEVDTLAALTERQGATIRPELRKAWMGERLGFAYADPAKRLPLPAHAYRLCMVVGVQPARAAGLLDDRDGGTPQRFVWLPATDPDAPDVPPAEPEPWPWRNPAASAWHAARPGDRQRVTVCATAREAVDAAHLARARGDGDALDGHALLCRLKVAAALGLLDSRVEVADEDWQLAGTVMAISNATRAGVVAELQRATRERNRARGEAEGERAVVVAERVEDDAIKKVSRRVTRLLGQTGDWTTRTVLRGAVAGRDRQHFDSAIERLTDAGLVEVETVQRDDNGHGGAGLRYRLRGGQR